MAFIQYKITSLLIDNNILVRIMCKFTVQYISRIIHRRIYEFARTENCLCIQLTKLTCTQRIYSSRHIRRNIRHTNFRVWSISCKPRSTKYFTIYLTRIIIQTICILKKQTTKTRNV